MGGFREGSKGVRLGMILTQQKNPLRRYSYTVRLSQYVRVFAAWFRTRHSAKGFEIKTEILCCDVRCNENAFALFPNSER